MKKITASLALFALLLTGAAFAAENSPTPDTKPQAGDRDASDRPIKRKGDKNRFRFKECDGNKDGVVTLEEYQACFPKGNIEHFNAMDADKDGKVTPEELQAWRESKRQEFEAKRIERRTEMFKKCDKDGNGALSLEEYLQCAPQPGKKRAPGHKPQRPAGKLQKPAPIDGKAS